MESRKRSPDLLSRLVFAVDRYMRRRLRIWEFSDDPDCLLRVALIRSRWEVTLRDGTIIRRGETIGMIHAWNERVPPIPPTGADMAWARQLRRRLIRSLQLLAQATREDPRLRTIRGFGGAGVLHFSPAILHLLERLGLEIYELPPQSLWDRVEEQVSRGWTWLMRRAFNPVSVEGRGLEVLSRRFYWIGREKLLQMYGEGESHER
ncbi:MAG: YkoP family protein [Anaerolineae bacterium]